VSALYVRILKNELWLKDLGTGKEKRVSASPPFTTARLLVGDFDAAALLLRRAFKEVHGGGLFAMAPGVVMHPMAMTEGGLSNVEERLLRELAVEAVRARHAVVWVGPELSDAQVREKLAGKR
jgi:rod shape-determining protein MreB